jgi:hypothetical protein
VADARRGKQIAAAPFLSHDVAPSGQFAAPFVHRIRPLQTITAAFGSFSVVAPPLVRRSCKWHNVAFSLEEPRRPARRQHAQTVMGALFLLRNIVWMPPNS